MVKDDELELDLLNIFSIIWKKKVVILIISLLLSGGVYIYKKSKYSPEYISRASILIDGGGASNTKANAVHQLFGIGQGTSSNPLMVIFNSRSYHQEVAKKLGRVKGDITPYQAGLSIPGALKIKDSPYDETKIISWSSGNSLISQKNLKIAIDVLRTSYAERIQNKKKVNMVFVEKRKNEIKEQLINTEEKLNQYLEESQGVGIDNQVSSLISQLNGLMNTLHQKKIEYEVQKRLLAKNSSKMKELEINIEVLGERIENLIGNQSEKTNKKKILHRNLNDVTDIKIKQDRMERDLRVKEKLYTLLSEQLENSKIDYQKESSHFEVIDPPDIPLNPDNKFSAAKSSLAALFACLIFLSLLILIAELIKSKLDQSPHAS